MENLQKSFPLKTEIELIKVAKGFYLNLSDIVVETLKALTITEEELKLRVEVDKIEILNDYLSKDQSVVVMTSHLCNWEWMLVRSGLSIATEIDAVYQPLNNAFFNKLMKQIRSRFNTIPITMKALPRELINRKKIPRAIALIADQTPTPETAYWTKFLNQETSFYLGPAKIALNLNYPIIYVEMKRLRRGKYILLFNKLTEPPYQKELQAEEIIEKYVQLTEKSISGQPSNWLWSHKRWKHKKEDYL